MMLCFPQEGMHKILLKMKLLTVLMLAAFAVSAANSYSQQTLFNLKLNNASVREVFQQIEDNSEFILLYNEKTLDVNREVDVKVKNKTVESVLDQVFAGTANTYKIYDRQIVILENENAELPSILRSKSEQPQKRVISGIVTGEDGQPIPGVSIIVVGTTTGIVTDYDGRFKLSIPDEAKNLQFSFVGMKTQVIPINGQTTFSIKMEEVTTGLEEVVAVGYGTQKKVNLTGAVSMATSERLENRPIVSTGQGLQGVIPNLNVSIRNGDPTRSADFNIRGFESINGGSPLILVDGVPMSLERINPNDIASVNVLKDAAAAAVYGARAAFGVILVETKKGKKGKVNVQLSTELSLAKPIYNVDVVTDPYVFVTEINKATIRTNGATYYDDDYVAGTKAWSENPTDENAWAVVNGVLRFYGYNDYQNKIITDFAPQQKYDMTISGASEGASYYVSFGFLNKDGYLKPANNENFKRYNILMKTDFKINDWLSLDEKIVFNSQVSDKPHFYNWDVNINTIARVSPILPIQFPDLPYYVEQGDHDQYAQYIGMYFGETNFLPYLLDGGRETFTKSDTWFTQGITLTPINNLKVRSDFSYNMYHNNYQNVASKVDIVSTNLLDAGMVSNGFSGNDWIDNRINYNQYYVFNTYAEYTLYQFPGHYVKAMVGFNQEWGRNTYVRAQANTLITPLITDLNATTGTQQTWGSKSHTSLRGIFYRLNYIYKDKYLLEANGRYDGTSRFPKDSRFGFFPSVSVGWRISNENFMKGAKDWLDNLKFRTSYGELGNQLLGNNYYPYIATMGSGMASYIMSSGRIPYVSAAGLVSPALTWETVATTNFGLDITLFDQRLDLSADIYTRDTKDMLMGVEYPDILGTSAPDANAADLRTKGWELAVTWRDKIGQDWEYGLTLALADNQAEITKYDNPTGALSEYYVGKKLGEIWGYETVGIFQYDENVAAAPNQSALGANWRAGDIQYADLNGDGVINRGSNTLDDPGDRKVIGNTTARYPFGLNGDLKYKNWALNTFFQGVGKRDYLPSSGSWDAFYPYNSGHVEKYYITETWSEDNRDAYFAAPHISINTKKNIQPQSRYVQNAAYIRLKNVTLSYNFPQDWVSKIGLSKAQIYFAGMNLWEYSKIHKPLDPEQLATLTQEYYFQRIFTLGAKITF